MTKQKEIAEYKFHDLRQAKGVALARRNEALDPFHSIKEATIAAIEFAIRASDNREKKRAWRKLHSMITKRQHDWHGDS